MHCDHCNVPAEMEAIHAVLERVEKAVVGNGQPGLTQRVGALEAWREGIRSVIQVGVWIVGTVIALGGAVWAALHK